MSNSVKKTDLDYIKAIAQSGSFLAASEVLHVSQPAISQYISKIEQEQGIQLFNRNVRPVTLTEAGRYYVKIEEEIEEMRRRRTRYFRDLSGDLEGEVRIGANQCRIATVLSDVLSAYVKKYPKVSLKIVEVGISTMEAKLLAGEIDCVITIEAAVSKELAYRTLLDEKVLLAFHADHPLGERARTYRKSGATGFLPFDFPEAAGENFSLLSRGMRFHAYFHRICEKYRVKPKILMQTDSITTLLELVTQGVGCALMPDSLIYYRHPEPMPCYYSMEHEFGVNRVVAAWNRNMYLSKATRAFIEMLAEKHRPLNSDPHTEPYNLIEN